MLNLPRVLRIAVLVAAVMSAVAGCSGDSTQQGSVDSTEVPDEVVTDFTTAETDSGTVAWKLTAPEAFKYNSKQLFLMDNPRIEFYDELGNLQTTLTSDKGEYFQASRDMLAYGNVVVVSVEGDVLETDSLRYVTADDQIVSDSRVKITRGRNVTTGIGLRCDHKLNSVEILKDVEAIIIDDKPREGERING
jgi:LPS export ABC transporter protein LptC